MNIQRIKKDGERSVEFMERSRSRSEHSTYRSNWY